jgi:hypothetical protein
MSWLGQALSIDLANTIVPAPCRPVDLLAKTAGLWEWLCQEKGRLGVAGEVDVRCLSLLRVLTLRDAARDLFDSAVDEISPLEGELGSSSRFDLPEFSHLWTVAMAQGSDDDLIFSHAVLASALKVFEAKPLTLRRCRLPTCGAFWEESVAGDRCPGCGGRG